MFGQRHIVVGLELAIWRIFESSSHVGDNVSVAVVPTNGALGKAEPTWILYSNDAMVSGLTRPGPGPGLGLGGMFPFVHFPFHNLGNTSVSGFGAMGDTCEQAASVKLYLVAL
jgi:hypothetical protein